MILSNMISCGIVEKTLAMMRYCDITERIIRGKKVSYRYSSKRNHVFRGLENRCGKEKGVVNKALNRRMSTNKRKER
jgi:hypothetical protein